MRYFTIRNVLIFAAVAFAAVFVLLRVTGLAG